MTRSRPIAAVMLALATMGCGGRPILSATSPTDQDRVRSRSENRPAALVLEDGRTIHARQVELKPDWTSWATSTPPGSRVETASIRRINLSTPGRRIAAYSTAGAVIGGALGLWLREMATDGDGGYVSVGILGVLGAMVGATQAVDEYDVVGAGPAEP